MTDFHDILYAKVVWCVIYRNVHIEPTQSLRTYEYIWDTSDVLNTAQDTEGDQGTVRERYEERYEEIHGSESGPGVDLGFV